MEMLIQQRLKEIEDKYNITIIYACESGSRAWGFASSDSDYDVRFIYIQRPSWYFTVYPSRDVIEVMDHENNLDLSGWELRKALGLLYKGNPPLLEWLNSPMVYRANPAATQELKTLAEGYYDVKSAIYHYLHMAEGNYKAYIRGKEDVYYKKYLYIARPLLACNWIEQNQTMAPMEIETTLALLKEPVKYEIMGLIEDKKAGQELQTAKPNPVLNEWIEDRLSYYLQYVKSLKGLQKDTEALDKYLYKWVNDDIIN